MTGQISCFGGTVSPEPRRGATPCGRARTLPPGSRISDYLCSISIIAALTCVPEKLEHVAGFRIPVDKEKG